MLFSIYKIIVIVYAVFGVAASDSSAETELIKNLQIAKKATTSALDKIYATWQIEKYPGFLRSCSMSRDSWEYMKNKFRSKIIRAATQKTKEKFIICFGGSSVTAGHDSPFNLSFSVLTGSLMKSSFSKLNVELISRNVAMGNNPCFPYDICMRTFCGTDPDIVIWEQSYFCDFNGHHVSTLEQFIRQTAMIPSHPIIVFTDSATPNWYNYDTIIIITIVIMIIYVSIYSLAYYILIYIILNIYLIAYLYMYVLKYSLCCLYILSTIHIYVSYRVVPYRILSGMRKTAPTASRHTKSPQRNLDY